MPFCKGDPRINRNGRPKVPEIDELRKALAKAQREHNQSFIEYFVGLAFKSENVAIALAKKILPDKIAGEGFSDKEVIIIREKLKEVVSGNQSRIIPSELPK